MDESELENLFDGGIDGLPVLMGVVGDSTCSIENELCEL